MNSQTAKIVLSLSELNACKDFARTSAKTQQPIEFGNNSTEERAVTEVARDTLIGKIAEVAFKKMIEEKYGIPIDLDFEYYQRGKWDDQDAVINGWRIDVKGTRSGGNWLLIEWNKLDFRQQQNRLAHAYAMFTVGWNRKQDVPTGEAFFEGMEYISFLRPNNKKVLVLKEGDCIPGTKARLQAYNYGIKFMDLYHNLDDTITKMKRNPPSDRLTDSFINPYDFFNIKH